MFDGYWAEDRRVGIGVSHTAVGERQEAWYVEDHIVRTPRIFFQPFLALPGRLGHRLAGSSLNVFCESDPERPTRPIRFHMHLVPSWLHHKQRHPKPPSIEHFVSTRLKVNDHGLITLCRTAHGIHSPRPTDRSALCAPP